MIIIGATGHTLQFLWADKRFFWTDGSYFQYVKWYMWALHDISLRTDGRFRSDWANDLCSIQYPFMCKVKQGKWPNQERLDANTLFTSILDK